MKKGKGSGIGLLHNAAKRVLDGSDGLSRFASLFPLHRRQGRREKKAFSIERPSLKRTDVFIKRFVS